MTTRAYKHPDDVLQREQICDNFIKLRRKYGIGQDPLGEAAGVGGGAVSVLESRRGNWKLWNLQRYLELIAEISGQGGIQLEVSTDPEVTFRGPLSARAEVLASQAGCGIPIVADPAVRDLLMLKLAQRRLDLGLSVREASGRAGMHHNSWYKGEAGHLDPSIPELQRRARAVETRLTFRFGPDEWWDR